MNNPKMEITPAPMFRALQPLPAMGMASPPSFARALRQRGLIAPAQVANDLPVAAPEAADSWIPALSLYEAHLQRQAMEQAFAALRGDRV